MFEPVKDCSQSVAVLVEGLRKDKDIIKVNKTDIIHEKRHSLTHFGLP